MKYMISFTVINLSLSMVDNNLASLATLEKKEAISTGSLKNTISKAHNSTPYNRALIFKIAPFSLIEKLHIIIPWNHQLYPSCLNSQKMKIIGIFIGSVMKNSCIRLNLQFSRCLSLTLFMFNSYIKWVNLTME